MYLVEAPLAAITASSRNKSAKLVVSYPKRLQVQDLFVTYTIIQRVYNQQFTHISLLVIYSLYNSVCDK